MNKLRIIRSSGLNQIDTSILYYFIQLFEVWYTFFRVEPKEKVAKICDICGATWRFHKFPKTLSPSNNVLNVTIK